VVIATDRFLDLARQSGERSGLSGTSAARIVRVAHPIGGVSTDELDRRADGAVDEIIARWLGASS
jgi:hypothetical protein